MSVNSVLWIKIYSTKKKFNQIAQPIIKHNSIDYFTGRICNYCRKRWIGVRGETKRSFANANEGIDNCSESQVRSEFNRISGKNNYRIYSRISRSAYKSNLQIRANFLSKMIGPCISRMLKKVYISDKNCINNVNFDYIYKFFYLMKKSNY